MGWIIRHRAGFLGAILLLAAGCGGAGGGSAGGGTTPTAPITAPTSPILLMQGAVQLTALNMTGTGSAYAQTFTAMQSGYGGAFSTSGCAANATVVTSGSSLTITGTAAGTCTLTVSNSFNQTATLPVTVTVTSVTTQ